MKYDKFYNNYNCHFFKYYLKIISEFYEKLVSLAIKLQETSTEYKISKEILGGCLVFGLFLT